MAVPGSTLLLDVIVLDSPVAILVGDWFRVLTLIMSAGIGALYLRAFLGRGVDVRSQACPGFRHRISAIALFTIFVCITEYGRLGMPVTVRLPLALAALGLSLTGIAALPRRTALDREKWLEGEDS